MVRVRSENSLVEQAQRLAGRNPAGLCPGTLSGPDGPLGPIVPPPIHPAEDGYVRRSPVQPLYCRQDRRRRLILRALGAVLLLAVLCAVAVLLLSRLNLIRL